MPEHEHRGVAAVSTRLLLADGQDLFRQGLRAVLAQFSDVCVVAEATCFAEACAAIEREQPEVVVTDYRLSGRTDGSVVPELTRLYPGLPLVVLTDAPPEECLHAALLAGAQGFVMKEARGDLVAKAIAAARIGGIWVQREAFARAVRHARGQVSGNGVPSAPLTRREQEVLARVSAGASTGEIAEELRVTPSIVRVHVLRVADKLGARSRTAMVRRAMDLGLVDP